jgi:hypothetical protein
MNSIFQAFPAIEQSRGARLDAGRQGEKGVNFTAFSP